MKNLLEKIQALPESKRKIILWLIIAILALILLSFYIKNVKERLKGLEMERVKEELPLPHLKEEWEKLPKIEIPKIEMPEIDQEKLKELEKAIKETQEQK